MFFGLVTFVSVFFYLSNYFQINAFFAQLGQKKIRKEIKDKYLSDLLKRVGLNVRKFIIFESEMPFAMMPAMFGRPQVIISSKLYKTFTKKEIEYVMMHEAAHYLFKHNLKAAGLELIYLLTGVLLLSFLQLNWMSGIGFGILLSILYVQTTREVTEREADTFAAKNSHPKSMISAAEKLQKAYFNGSKTNYLFKNLFSWNVMPKERIRIAETYMVK